MNTRFGSAWEWLGPVDTQRSEPPIDGYPAARMSSSGCDYSSSWKCQMAAASFMTAVAGQGGEAADG